MPVSWNELNKKQLIAVCALFDQNLNETEFLALAPLHLTGMKIIDKKEDRLNHSFRYRGKRITMSAFQLRTFAERCHFLLELPTLNQQKIPFLWIRGRKYYGPSDMLFNITFGEWLQVDIYMQHYRKSKDPKYLRYAAAAMYRTKERKGELRKGDIRKPFNEYSIERDARKFNRVSIAKLRAISIFFDGCMVGLRKQFPLTLQESSGSSTRKNMLKDTLMLIDQLNHDDVTKNEAVQRTRFYEVLTKLEATRERAQKLREKTKA